jgi:uncharacterized protein YciI
MALFVVVWRYTDDTSLVDETRPLHREYLMGMVERGEVRQAGPWADGTGGLLVFEVATEAELVALLDADPYTKAGVVVDQQIHEWKAVVGPLAG